jgi:hypothetical protein
MWKILFVFFFFVIAVIYFVNKKKSQESILRGFKQKYRICLQGFIYLKQKRSKEPFARLKKGFFYKISLKGWLEIFSFSTVLK